MSTIDEKPISVSLLTGFLGSGKTTLLNHLLAHPDMDKTAVLINEFGEIGLDHLIVGRLDEDVVLLKSGCICCTVQGQLVDGLKELYVKRLAGQTPAFTRLVIETTGLADPLPIVDCLMRDPLFRRVYRLDTVVTTVDAVYGGGQLDMHREAIHQAAIADNIVITKDDISDKARIGSLRERLSRLNPGAKIISAQFGQVTPGELFGSGFVDLQQKFLDMRKWFGTAEHSGQSANTHDQHGAHDHVQEDHGHAGRAHEEHEHVDVNRHDERIASFCIVLDEAVSWEAFTRWYDDLAEKKADHLLRVKGILNVENTPTPVFVHCVQSTQHDPTLLPSWPDDDHRSRIVFITRDLARGEVEANLRARLAAARTDSGSNRAHGTPTFVQPPGASRWLNQAELSRLFAALLLQNDRFAVDVLRLMLLTGVDSEATRLARWEDFDIDQHLWLLPHAAATKPGVGARARRISLHSTALTLLAGLRQRGTSRGYLFGGSKPETSAERLDRAWKTATEQAKIQRIALTELQPTLAIDVFAGLAPTLVRVLLGLASQAAPKVALSVPKTSADLTR